MTENEFANKKRQMFARIVGCAFRAYNYFHAGMDEIVYEAGLVVELEQHSMLVHRQEEFPIYYRGVPSPVKRRMDLVVHDSDLGDIIIELKALDYISDVQRRQLWTYMKLMNCRYGMLINFNDEGVYSEDWELNLTTGFCTRV